MVFVESPNLADLQSYVESLPFWGVNSSDRFNNVSKKPDT